MKYIKFLVLMSLVLTAAGCQSTVDSDSFATQVAQEIWATQTASASETQDAFQTASGTKPAGTEITATEKAVVEAPPVYTPIQAENSHLLQTLATFSGDHVTHLVAAENANVLAYASSDGVHLLDPRTFAEAGLIAVPEGIDDLAISPDGRFIATGTNQQILIWSIPDLAQLGAINYAYLKKLAFSPDSRLLVGIDYQGIYGWQVPDGKLRFSTEGAEDGWGNSLGGGETFAFVPNTGKIIFPVFNYISSNEEDVVEIEIEWYWVDPLTGTLDYVAMSLDHTKNDYASISEISFAPDGATIALSWDGFPVEVWSFSQSSLEYSFSLPVETTDAKQAVFSIDGRYFGVVTWDGSSYLVDALTQQILFRWSGKNIAFLSEGAEAALVTNTEIQRVNLASGEVNASIPYSEIKAFAFLPKGGIVAVGWNDGRVEIWSQRGQILERSLDSGIDNLSSLYYHPMCDCLVAHSRSGEILLWQAANWEKFLLPPGTKDWAVAPGSNVLATTTSEPNQLLIWGESKDQPQFILEHPAPVQGFGFALVDPWIAVHLSDGSTWLWDWSAGTYLRSIEDNIDRVILDTFINDGQWLAAIGSDNTIKIWSIQDASLLYSQEFDFPISYATYFPSAQAFLVEDWESENCYLWRTGNSTIEEYPGDLLDFTSGGEFFVTRFQGETKIIRTSDGSVVRSLTSGNFLRFSWDGSLIFWQQYPEDPVGSPTLEVHSMEGGEILTSIELDGFIGYLLLSQDGSTIAGISHKGSLSIWGIP